MSASGIGVLKAATKKMLANQLLDQLINDIFKLIPQEYKEGIQAGDSLNVKEPSLDSHKVLFAQYKALLLLKEHGDIADFYWAKRNADKIDENLEHHLEMLDQVKRYLVLDKDNPEILHELEKQNGRWLWDGMPYEHDVITRNGGITIHQRENIFSMKIYEVTPQYSWIPSVKDDLSFELGSKLSKFFEELSKIAEDGARDELIRKHNLLERRLERYRLQYVEKKLQKLKSAFEQHKIKKYILKDEKKNILQELVNLKNEAEKIKNNNKRKNELQYQMQQIQNAISCLRVESTKSEYVEMSLSELKQKHSLPLTSEQPPKAQRDCAGWQFSCFKRSSSSKACITKTDTKSLDSYIKQREQAETQMQKDTQEAIYAARLNALKHILTLIENHKFKLNGGGEKIAGNPGLVSRNAAVFHFQANYAIKYGVHVADDQWGWEGIVKTFNAIEEKGLNKATSSCFFNRGARDQSTADLYQEILNTIRDATAMLPITSKQTAQPAQALVARR